LIEADESEGDLVASTLIVEPVQDVTKDIISEFSEAEAAKDVEIDSDLGEGLLEKKSAKKKIKKSKKNKYTLKEFSGISPFSKWLLTFKKTDIDKKIISEPLADLLASQGHFDEAKKMYEQMMMKYPEKSSYFASKINQNIKY
jgi:pentatricopeptide repeat protein